MSIVHFGSQSLDSRNTLKIYILGMQYPIISVFFMMSGYVLKWPDPDTPTAKFLLV
jgi:hypothetical protein